jgi:hypothetical protein
MGMLDYYRDKNTIKNIILAQASRRKEVIYGAQSVNIQLPKDLNKETKDYDVLDFDSEGAANELATSLNKEYGKSDKFEVSEALHKGTFKVKDSKGETIADYTKTTKKPKSVGNLGVRYAGLDYQKRNIKKSLKNPQAEFRREKDTDTLRRIKAGTRKWMSAGWKK